MTSLSTNGGIHASAVIVGERGVLIRGPSGAGKSLLTLALISQARRDNGFAALVADDRVWLEVAGDRLLARGASKLAGVCERRGEGLIEVPYEAQVVLRLIVDIAERGAPQPRIPQAADKYATLKGLSLPRLRVDLSPGLYEGVAAVISALSRVEGATWRKIVLNDTVFA